MSLTFAVPCGAAQEGFEMEGSFFRKTKTSEVWTRGG